MTPGPVSESSPGPPDGSPLDTPICIVFSGSGPNLRFIEVETDEGKGLNVGEWTEHCSDDALSVLKVTPRSILKGLGLADDFEVLRCAFCGFEYVGPDHAPREDLEDHILKCPDHPARELVRFLDALPQATVAVLPSDMRARLNELVLRWHPTGSFPKVVMDQIVTVEQMSEVAQENVRLHEQFDSYPGAFQAFETEHAKMLEVIRTAHRAGYKHGMGACVCEYCKPEEAKTDG